MTSLSPRLRVTPMDWTLAGIAAGLTLAGLGLLPGDFKNGVALLAMAGLGLVHTLHVILRKRRLARLGSVSARVTGGVRLRPSRLQFALYGAALLAVGAVLASVAGPRDAQMGGGGWLSMLVGGGMLAGVAVGWLPLGHLQFDPDGLTVGDRGGQTRVPWDAITGLGGNEVDGQPAVLLTVDAHALVPMPPGHGAQLARRLAWARGKAGVDIIIFSHDYGIAAPVLLAALERYVTEPAARQELAATPRLAG